MSTCSKFWSAIATFWVQSCIAGNFWRRKPSRILRFWGYLWKFSLWSLGAWHPLWKFSQQKLYLLPIRSLKSLSLYVAQLSCPAWNYRLLPASVLQHSHIHVLSVCVPIELKKPYSRSAVNKIPVGNQEAPKDSTMQVLQFCSYWSADGKLLNLSVPQYLCLHYVETKK